MSDELTYGTTDITRIDAGAYFLLAELESIKAANYGARAGQTIAGHLGRDASGHWVRVGEDGKPLARSGSTLVRDAQRDASRASAADPKTPKGKAGGKGKGGSGGKGTKPKQTPEEKRQAREAEHATNRDAVFSKLSVPADARTDLIALAAGDQPEKNPDGLVSMGLATIDSAGEARLTPQGRALLAAAAAGDAGRARDAISLGMDRVVAAHAKDERAKGREATRQQKQAEREQKAKEREQRRIEREKQHEKDKRAKETAAGAHATPSAMQPKPTRQEQRQQNRADTQAAMQQQNSGLQGPAFGALMQFADGDSTGDVAVLQQLADETGLLEQSDAGDFRLTKDGRAFVQASNANDVRGALDALSRGIDTAAASAAESETMDTPDTPAAKLFHADGTAHPGAMLAFLLDDATIAALQDACEGVDVTPDHMTLIYLTPSAEDLDAQKNALILQLAQLCSDAVPLSATINGYGRFAGAEDDDTNALYANVDSPALPEFRARLMTIAECVDAVAEQTHGFTPHITLAYLDQDAPTPHLALPQLQLTFDRVALVWAGETITFPLLGDTEDIGHAIPGSEVVPPEIVPSLDDTLIYAGDMVKSLGNGHVGGYLVRFGSPEQTDLAGDYFTNQTDFGITPGAKTAVYFNHRLPFKTRDGRSITIKEQIGEGVLGMDQHGVFIDAVLYNRAQYQQILDQLGWSSGTATHLVDRQRVGGKAAFLKKWPLGLDASLTPGPCEPRAVALPLKSYQPAEVAEASWPEAATAASASAQSTMGAPYINVKTSSKETIPVDKDELQAFLGEAFKTFGAQIETKMAEAVDIRLKAFEDSPALKKSGFISPDGGTADKSVKNFADWLMAVKRNDVKRLQGVYGSAYTNFGGDGPAVKDLNESSGSAGGYLVPTEYEPELQRLSAEAAIVEPRARQFKMGSASKMVPMLKQTANPSTVAGGSAFFGGLTFQWNPEAGDISTDKSEPVWEMIELIARKLTGLTVASNDLIEDAASIQSELTQLFAEGLAHAKDFFYLRGDGVGKPLGVLNAACAYPLTRKSSGNNVEIEDISGMMARLLPGSFANAIWVSHPLNIADFIQLKIGDVPVFQPDARGPIAGTLLGRPIAFSEYAVAPGSKGDLMLCDFKAYGVGMRRGIAIASSEHARFDKDQTTWKITYRGDGQPLLSSTVKLADGSNTAVSPFVILN